MVVPVAGMPVVVIVTVAVVVVVTNIRTLWVVIVAGSAHNHAKMDARVRICGHKQQYPHRGKYCKSELFHILRLCFQ